MKKICTFFLFLYSFSLINAQQIANWSSYYENGFVWNPALTAKWNTTEFSLTHQQEWIGFDAAPKYSTLSFQYPFSKYGNFTKAGIGAYLDYDKIGPFTKTGAALTYTYRIRPQLFGNNDDYLSFGIGGQMSRYTFRSDDLVGLDGISTDPQLIEQAQTSLKPNFNFGVFYMNAPCKVIIMWVFQ